MKNAWLFLLILGLSPAIHAQDPVENAEAYESRFIDCVSNDKRGKNCLPELLRRHIRVRSESFDQQVEAAIDFFYRWLAEDRVHAVHRVVAEDRGAFARYRAYIIEDDQGNYLLFEFTLLSMKSRWYLNRFNFNNQEEEMERVLGIDI